MQGEQTVIPTRTANRLLSGALAALSTVAIVLPPIALADDLQLAADQPSATSDLNSARGAAKAGIESPVYIIQFEDAPVATYMGEISGLPATANRATGAKKLDTNSDNSKRYQAHLRQQQRKLIADSEDVLGRNIDVNYDYQIVLNAVAAELSEAEADALRNVPGVKAVVRERYETLQTDVGPEWINAPDLLSGPPNNLPHSMGEGIVIAILDSGINSDHPSFADVGSDGYDHTNPLGSGNYVPGSHCDVVDPAFCNDKLIGAWDFTGPADGDTPEDTDGHGSHTAGTAAGNVVTGATLVAPTTSLTRDITGVLPHANIIAYDVCIDSCPGSALIAAINQVVIDAANLPDGIHALNYSISGGSDPYNDIVELGFLNATAAGVYVAASAGNSGPGPSTTGHNSPWVSTTASMTHNRKVVNAVVDMASDGDSLADLVGVGLTSGYGPAPIINSADLEADFPGSTLCGLGSIGDFIPPWPPGTFNGEIVACTRGTFGRVEKGANVLAAGAGGYILMDNGSGVVGDAHVLPGVHISQDDGNTLAAWLAANENPEGSISGYSLDLDEDNGDIMAGSSSRGPAIAVDVIKPDIGGPGVSVFAAEADGQALAAPEYQFLSGTSMSSPHNAGSGALLGAARPDWTPYEIRSALMMTANREGVRKEDGVTPVDPFDTGAGRLDLSRAQEVGIVLDETPANFLAANPETGGDPKTLNLASMQDSVCVGTCSWTRTVRNVEQHSGHWDLSTMSSAGLGLSVSPGSSLKVKAGESAAITVTADTTLAPAGWHFGSLELARKGDGPDLHMPIAVRAATSSNPELLTKSVDAASAAVGEPLNYEINLVNGPLTGTIDLTDVLPDGVDYVEGSAAAVVTNGTTITPFAHSGGELAWSGTLDVGGMDLAETPSPFGFFPLASLGVAPFACPSNCDDGGFFLNVPGFTFNGQAYSQVIWSVNGTIEAGTASGQATSASNQNMPDPSVPNNLIAPLWTDLNLGAGGNWYVAVLNAGPNQYTVYEWSDVPLFGDLGNRYSFQIWVQNGASGNIWITYAQLGDVGGATVGVEDESGSIGASYWFEGAGTAPAVGTDLKVRNLDGGTATFTFQGQISGCSAGEALVNRVNVDTADTSDTAIAVTQCVAN